ncbi:Fe-S cluster assembly ATPase SufC [Thermaerobacter sp. PB12/4term]|uniref:Fe-S cluster assembly ATPase SufC n=1 Tax=Thermaerobacter sp. PB12/4term TaxID=2293838 RepID=UPI000E3273BB|nr:Fe-S cluster assembly ATPase SufC [Thermaerobacter sp. PB12/4term]QIA26188.1 Fe-S cluster assembly ATPase SufC [Thermaerobacter sp. PB12/4term]
MASTLEIRELRCNVEDKEILKGVNLTVRQGEVHAIMGPNGSGKSTLAYTLMGHPRYEVTGGEVLLDGENLLELPPDERARKGLFLAFQYPQEVPGVTVANFLRTAVNSVRGEAPAGPAGSGKNLAALAALQKEIEGALEQLRWDPSFTRRYLNEGFSGGEKKKGEMLQMAVLKPKFAIMDETDSGLDIDALKDVARVFNSLRGPELGAIIITHYQRILQYIEPDFVHIMVDGRIVRSGGRELAEEVEAKGYDWIKAQVG